MHHFDYREGVMHAEGVDLRTIAKDIGTPFYCYSSATLERHYRVFAKAFADTDALVCYAMKANSNQAALKTARQGAGMDIVSGGELRRALAAGVPGERIAFSGVAKTKTEMALALDSRILCFNVESEPELEALSEVAVGKGTRAAISIRINPDVDAKTHKKISTGKSENKFGILIALARDVYARAAALKGSKSPASHIGSQITDLQPYDNATALLAELARDLMADGTSCPTSTSRRPRHSLPRGQRASPDPEAYAALVKRHTRGLGLKLIFEIGRMIVGNAGISSLKSST